MEQDKKYTKVGEEEINREYYFFSFVYKKTERLTTAIYMVTNFLSDLEPLKWKLRDASLRHLEDSLFIKDNAIKDTQKVSSSFKISLVKEILSMLEISFSAGLISEMNFTLLKEEYINLLDLISEQKDLRQEGLNVLSKDFFNTEESKGKGIFFLTESDTSKGQDKGHQSAQDDSVKTDSKEKQNAETIKDILNDKRQIKTFKANEYKNYPVNNERRERILDIIRLKKEVMIKDLSVIINGCSEKTIQRELISMVKDNVLKKEGERRWSKYSLNLSLGE